MDKLKLPGYIVTKTKNHNSYLYNIYSHQLIFLHPVLAYIIFLYQREIDLGKWCQLKHGKTIIIDNRKYGYGEIEYYMKKFNFLVSNNIINEIDFNKKLSYSLIESDIKYQFSNANYIAFEITESCNLKCEYCVYGNYYDHYNERRGKRMAFEDAKRFIDFIIPFWNSSQNQSVGNSIHIYFYGGEPLLNYTFIKKMVTYIRKIENTIKNKRVIFGITTNGTLIDKYIQFLVDNRFEVLISLDGDFQANKYRIYKNGKDSYDKVFNNILKIRDKYPEYFKHKVNFNSIINKYSSYVSIMDFFYKHFKKKPRISELNPLINDKNKKSIYKSIFDNLDYNQLLDTKDPSKLPDITDKIEFVKNVLNHRYESYLTLFVDEESKCYLPTGSCLPFSRRIFITADGLILPCETIPHKYNIGRIYSEKIDLDFKTIAERYNEFLGLIIKQCCKCYNHKNCKICYFLFIGDGKSCTQFANAAHYAKRFAGQLELFETNQNFYKSLVKN